MLAVVEYLHVAFSSVVSESEVWVVLAGRVPDGAALERTGGVVSEEGGETAAPGSQLPHCAPRSDSSPSRPNLQISQTCWLV